MRISPKQYAAALASGLEGKNSEEGKQAIENFCRILHVNNHLFLAEKIIKEFIKQRNRLEGLIDAEIVSAKELDAGLLKDIEEYVSVKMAAKKVNLKQNIDPKLLGGVVLKFADKILDASLATKLNMLKAEMKK